MDLFGELIKPNTEEFAVGFDLTDTYSQISYTRMDDEKVDTLSVVPGGNSYLIPTALFKRKEVNQWFAGNDAVRNRDTDGFFVDRLLERAMPGEDIAVGDENFRPSALIALFMKRSLSLLSMNVPLNKISSLMITVSSLDDRMVEVLTEVVASLGLKTENVFFQSHMESFYYYTIYQPTELWNRDVLLLDFSEEYLKSFRMECNKNTTPVVAFIDPESYHSFKNDDIKDLIINSEEARYADGELNKLVHEICDGRIVSSVYFIGENFRQEIFGETIRTVVKSSRVFEGNNLYSKGAAYSAKNKLHKTLLSESHVFLGNDKLKSNVGLNVLKRGEPGYLALLDAGVNWFEASNSVEVIIDKGNKLSFVITPLTGKNPEVEDITLADLPKRPQKTSRVRVDVSMISEMRMQVVIKDLGFGELFKASDIEWKEVINL